eukprot:COSAG05_NODE_1013_length_6190_cov_4.171236_3_plen_97_part_00
MFDKNGDGVIDADELVAILSRGNDLHVFTPEKAATVAGDVIKYWASEDGKLRVEGFCEFIKHERAFQAMSTEEKAAWFEENPEYNYTQAEVMGGAE